MWGSSPARDHLHSSRPVEIKVRDLDAERNGKPPVSTPLSMGWLLRLFRSEFFDAFMAVTYLYRYRDSAGVQDYLCNQLYALTDKDLESFMPQVCNLLVHHARHSVALERFVLDKCAHSMHIALQVYWFLQAAVEDAGRKPDRVAETRVRLLRTRCETAAVNGSKRVMLAAAAERISAATLVAAEPPFSPRERLVSAQGLFPSSSATNLSNNHPDLPTKLAQLSISEPVLQSEGSASPQSSHASESSDPPEQSSPPPEKNENEGKLHHSDDTQQTAPKVPPLSIEDSPTRALPDPEADFDPLALLAMKKERFDYFNDSISIAKAFMRLSLTTREVPQEQRQAHLVKGLENINSMLLRRMKGEPGEPLMEELSAPPKVEDIVNLGYNAALRSIHLPLARASSQTLRILRVHSEEAVILTSRTRAPYLVNIEVLPTDMVCSDNLLFCEHRVQSTNKDSQENEEDSKKGCGIATRRARRARSRSLSEMTPSERQCAHVRKAVYKDAFAAQPFEFAEAEMRANSEGENVESEEYRARQAVILGVYGELWSWKEERILGKSPFKSLKGAKLMPFIVKGGDDLRQEQLAIQLISQFRKIFAEEGVNLYLKAFTVMSVSSEAGFVEVIKDAVSVHSLKKRTPNFVSLLEYFVHAYGAIGTDTFRAAQRRFIESMAGYSLVTYLLQIKDRHNGNIMLDASGRIIHIDFGFMLTNSPGAIKFENVPFKLTEEYLQVICARKNVQDGEARQTEGYRYFQELFVLGLLAGRKHYEKVTMLVEIMTEGTTMPCMTSGQSSGQSIVDALRGRFAVGMPEEQCINFALALIDESRLSWRSAGYDKFQAYSNGYR